MHRIEDFVVHVPASTANLGPGFDTLAMALGLRNEFEVRQSDSAHRIKNSGQITPELDDPSRNSFFVAYEETCRRHGLPIVSLAVSATNNIPLQSGLGSSASALAAGVSAAYHVHGLALDRLQLLTDALRFESHPDNLSACIYGGFTVAVLADEGPLVSKTRIDYPLCVWIVHPHRVVNTAESRQKLPRQMSTIDVVYSLSRATLLTAALIKGELHFLFECMKDRIHEPYRMDPHMEYPVLKERLRGPEFHGWAVSGSGPSIVIFCSKVTEHMRATVADYFRDKGVAFDDYELPVDNDGLQVSPTRALTSVAT